MSLPENIKPVWWNGLTQRLQQAACSQNGYAIIRISVMVDKDGNPVLWNEPIVTRIEPKGRSSAFLAAILKDL